jgi:hypothetical protein
VALALQARAFSVQPPQTGAQARRSAAGSTTTKFPTRSASTASAASVTFRAGTGCATKSPTPLAPIKYTPNFFPKPAWPELRRLDCRSQLGCPRSALSKVNLTRAFVHSCNRSTCTNMRCCSSWCGGHLRWSWPFAGCSFGLCSCSHGHTRHLKLWATVLAKLLTTVYSKPTCQRAGANSFACHKTQKQR